MKAADEQDATMSDLTVLLLETGILQFGRFASGTGWEPYRLNFHLLPSYPDVLNQLVEPAVRLVGEVDHLVCAASTLPFGVGLSLQTGIPLVYSRETDEAPVYDLVGAYDIGHPALLLAYRSGKLAQHQTLLGHSHKVGLEISRGLVLVDEGFPILNNIVMASLLRLPDMLEMLVNADLLPAGQGRVVQNWINSHPPG